MWCASSAASSASISALCFRSSAILFVFTGASAAPWPARAAAQMMRRRRPLAMLRQVGAGSPRKESSSDFLRARLSVQGKRLPTSPSIPPATRISVVMSWCYSSLSSSWLRSSAWVGREGRKGSGARAVGDRWLCKKDGCAKGHKTRHRGARFWRWLPPWQRVLATERARGTHASILRHLQQIAHRCDEPVSSTGEHPKSSPVRKQRCCAKR